MALVPRWFSPYCSNNIGSLVIVDAIDYFVRDPENRVSGISSEVLAVIGTKFGAPMRWPWLEEESVSARRIKVR